MEITGDIATQPTLAKYYKLKDPDTDIPQNAPAAFTRALDSGLRYLEIDVVLNYDINMPSAPKKAYLGHYVDLFGAGNGTTSDVEPNTRSPGWMFSGSDPDYLTLRGNFLREVDQDNPDYQWIRK